MNHRGNENNFYLSTVLQEILRKVKNKLKCWKSFQAKLFLNTTSVYGLLEL